MLISLALIALQSTGNIAPMVQFATFLRIISFAMSLLLSYRLNRSYDRWWEARKAFAGIGSAATALAIQATTFVKNRPDLLESFRRWTILWAFSVKQVLEDSKELDPIAAELLYEEELAVYKASRKGRQVVVTKLYQLVEEAGLPDEATSIMLDTISNGVRSSGDCTRIHYQCMPIGVAYACGGFIQIWCYLLPFGAIQELPPENGEWYFLPIPNVGTFIIQMVGIWLAVLMLLGIDEVTNQLEHPYHLLPMEALALTYHRDINRVLQESMDLKLATEAGMRRLAKESESASHLSPSDLPSTPRTGPNHDPSQLSSADTSQVLNTNGPFGLMQRMMHLNALGASRRFSRSPSLSGAKTSDPAEQPGGESEFDDYIESSQWKKLGDWRDAVLADALQATGMASGEMSRIPSHVSQAAALRSSFKKTGQSVLKELASIKDMPIPEDEPFSKGVEKKSGQEHGQEVTIVISEEAAGASSTRSDATPKPSDEPRHA